VPLTVDGRRVATLTADLDNQALFIEDDIALLEILGSLTARTVERERAVADLAEATRAVAEATAVRASEARFRALLDAEPNAMLAVDSGGRIRWSTKSAADMFGLTEAELAERTVDDLVAARVETAGRRPGSGEPVRYETSGRRANGESFPAEVALTTFDFEGEPHRLAVISDITWRHEANAIRERFIGVLSHELRTPITAIFGGTQVLLSRGSALDAAIQRDLLTDVAGESERLQRMIENLLVLARVEGGNEVAEAGPVLLHRVLPDVIARERAMWPGMSIVIEAPTTLPPVIGDEASLALVVRNLISNAGKYAGAAATVRVVVTSEPPSTVSVRVLDDGPGIEIDETERLFDLYFRSKKNHSVPGSGIGLFVCQQLVGAMGGRMWATSRPEGGAEFGFALPVYTEADEPIADRVPARESAWTARPSAPSAALPATSS
jgi:PAS domain S-box-containing protein